LIGRLSSSDGRSVSSSSSSSSSSGRQQGTGGIRAETAMGGMVSGMTRGSGTSSGMVGSLAKQVGWLSSHTGSGTGLWTECFDSQCAMIWDMGTQGVAAGGLWETRHGQVMVMGRIRIGAGARATVTGINGRIELNYLGHKSRLLGLQGRVQLQCLIGGVWSKGS
jgi:hypothetical protein